MIGKISGTLVELHGNEALIETSGGVSYLVFVGTSFIDKKGEKINLYTYLNVKEDELSLFGFLTYEEYSLFKMIKSVDGVGPKTAFSIVQSSQYVDIRTAIINKDVHFFERIKGIGKKTAQKILLELSSKLGVDFELGDIEETKDNLDAIEALKALGYKASQVREIVHDLEPTLTLEDKIKKTLQKLH